MCESHPATTVVRFTSLFYNFVWIWGADERCRNLFTDWASYDFTVSPRALRLFEERYGYALTAEDFINKGRLHVTHMPPTPQKKDWMAFVNDFVISFGRRLIDIVHEYGKKAYVFYDDSWVGVEPYNGRFREFGFDGLIKCVFSGYEARLCARRGRGHPRAPPAPLSLPRGPGRRAHLYGGRRPDARRASSTGSACAAPCCARQWTASAWAATCTSRRDSRISWTASPGSPMNSAPSAPITRRARAVAREKRAWPCCTAGASSAPGRSPAISTKRSAMTSSMSTRRSPACRSTSRSSALRT